MKYKEGDKVRLVNSLIYAGNRRSGLDIFRDWLGKVVTIDSAKDGFYTAKEIKGYFLTEDLIAERVFTIAEEAENWVNDFLATSNAIHFGITPPDGYEFKDENGNVINATKIVLEKKKKEFPKTYEECLKILNIPFAALYIQQPPRFNYKLDLLHKLQTLLICRDAYWKIAGEEMGLGKPWKPDWLDDDTRKYVITSSKVFETFGGLGYINYILTFPTEEMRDAFYENFKELIESCKELL